VLLDSCGALALGCVLFLVMLTWEWRSRARARAGYAGDQADFEIAA
jgi:hypothetical protein